MQLPHKSHPPKEGKKMRIMKMKKQNAAAYASHRERMTFLWATQLRVLMKTHSQDTHKIKPNWVYFT